MEEVYYDHLNQPMILTKEQQECLKYTGDKVLMVKGVAGAGKSVVIQTLAKKLVDAYSNSAENKVAIFTYQNTLVSTTKEFLEINGTSSEGVLVATVNSHIKAIYDEMVAIGKAPKKTFPFSIKGDSQRLKNVEIAIEQHRKKYGYHKFHDLPYKFWLDEFDWMKRRNIWTTDKAHYITIKRKGRGGNVRMTAAHKTVAFQIYTCYCEYLEKSGQGDWADQTLYVVRHPEAIPDKYKYTHILIDEAQDLSCAQMLALIALIHNGGDMTIAMDINQRIHSTEWTPKMIGIDAAVKKLTKSMRTTIQIDALAESVRCINDDNLDEDDKNNNAKPEKSGPIPVLAHLDSRPAEKKYVTDVIKRTLIEYPQATIGIIASMNKQLNIYSEWMTDAGINHEIVAAKNTFSMKTKGVKIATAFSAKGLEFNFVIIPMFAEGYFPYTHAVENAEEYETFMFKMRNLVYVSMTRAKNGLYISWWGNGGSRFIADMDKSLYQLVGEPFDIKPSKSYMISDNVTDNSIVEEAKEPAINVENTPKTINSNHKDLVSYLESFGLKVIDKRDKGGALWVIGGKEIAPIIKGCKDVYTSLWTFTEKGGSASGYKPAWYTKSSK